MITKKHPMFSLLALACLFCLTIVGHVSDNCRTRVRQLSDETKVRMFPGKTGYLFRKRPYMRQTLQKTTQAKAAE
jgi:hypothetical protein